MKIARYRHAGTESFGRLEGETIIPMQGPLEALQPVEGAPQLRLADVNLLAPTRPSKIVAIGPGYKALVADRKPARPYFWIKPSTTVLDPEGEILLPPGLTVNHEAEIGIVMGRTTRNVSPDRAMDHVLGYTCVHDVTAGDMSDMAAYLQTQLFLDGKIFDTFAPIGPVIVTDLDPSDVRIQCRVNGETRHDHRASDKLWPYGELISLISAILTLHPGDVIATGSVPGVRPMKAGDTIEIEIDGIGILRNRAVAATDRPA
jgi:2-keto-4-pentenoate hydratase/2-oxohepta-3-ene-1,7-dioic acid hydratase in catechol pathway